MTLLLAQLNRLNTMCRHSKVRAKIVVHDEHCYRIILFSSFTLSSSCFRVLLACSTGVIFRVFMPAKANGKRACVENGEAIEDHIKVEVLKVDLGFTFTLK